METAVSRLHRGRSSYRPKRRDGEETKENRILTLLRFSRSDAALLRAIAEDQELYGGCSETPGQLGLRIGCQQEWVDRRLKRMQALGYVFMTEEPHPVVRGRRLRVRRLSPLLLEAMR